MQHSKRSPAILWAYRVALIALLWCLHGASVADNFRIEVLVAKDLDTPWGIAFLPNGDALITERPGRLRLFANGQLKALPIRGLPEIQAHRQGGLMGIALHPAFSENKLVYLSVAARVGNKYSTAVIRGRFDGAALLDIEQIFTAHPLSKSGRHFGGRLAFDDAGFLFISLGDRGRRDGAQDLSQHAGSLIRVHDDGRIPKDNPFVADATVAPGIYTFGARNMQGLTLNPETRELWALDHGPKGGDEVNIIKAGTNYGWPVISYGRNYGFGTKIGEGTHKAGMAQPVYKWDYSIGPSGMAFYQGDKFPHWRGNLFVGSLKFGALVRLEIEADKVVREYRMLKNRFGSVRDVVVGDDGYLYVLAGNARGKLLRLTPL